VAMGVIQYRPPSAWIIEVVLFTSVVHAPKAGDRVIPLFVYTHRLGYTVSYSQAFPVTTDVKSTIHSNSGIVDRGRTRCFYLSGLIWERGLFPKLGAAGVVKGGGSITFWKLYT
jgi:hypothetical protein